MKMEYDKEVDAAFIYLKDSIKPEEVKKTLTLNRNINLDFTRTRS